MLRKLPYKPSRSALIAKLAAWACQRQPDAVFLAGLVSILEAEVEGFTSSQFYATMLQLEGGEAHGKR